MNKIVKGMVAALIASASLVSPHLFSAVAYGVEIDYYSDATYTEIVGNYTMLCSNQSALFGEQTPYSREVARWSCDTGFPSRPPAP